MFNFVHLLLTTTGLVTVDALSTGPPPTRVLEYQEVMNRTICAMDTAIDFNPNRIPKKILTMKCAAQTDIWCKEYGVRPEICCQASGEGFLLQCVELSARVLVHYTDTNETMPYYISVGCTCIRSTVKMAGIVDSIKSS